VWTLHGLPLTVGPCPEPGSRDSRIGGLKKGRNQIWVNDPDPNSPVTTGADLVARLRPLHVVAVAPWEKFLASLLDQD
jgi:hypothetical protein